MRRWAALGAGCLLLLAGIAWGQPRAFVHVFQQAQAGIAPGAAAHVLGYTNLVVHVAAAGTPSFNVHFQASLDGTSWSQHHCQALSLTANAAGTATSSVFMHTALGTGLWRCNVAGLAFFRAHVTAFTGSTSVTVLGAAMSLPGATGWE